MNVIVTYARALAVEIYLYYSIGILVLEHFVHDLMLCSCIYMVSYCEAKRSCIKVIPILKNQ